MSGRVAATDDFGGEDKQVSQDTKPQVWFVRSNKNGGAYPVTPEGWRTVWTFTGLAVVSVIVGISLHKAGLPYWWLGTLVGAVLSAAWFLHTTNRHTDYSMNVADFKKLNSPE